MMTKNLKAFMEEASKDPDYMQKLKEAGGPEEVIALAAQKGFSLTEEDLKNTCPNDRLSDEELEAVAGGVENKKCTCVVGGGGVASGDSDLCWCTGIGSGDTTGDLPKQRCVCVIGGSGKDL